MILLFQVEPLSLPRHAELIATLLTVVMVSEMLVRIVMMLTNKLVMDVLLIVPLNAVTEELMLENNVMLEPLSTIKNLPTDADLDVSASSVVMVSEMPTNNVITEPPTQILSETLVVLTVSTHSVVMELLITENNVIL
jgi:hypothetical protein